MPPTVEHRIDVEEVDQSVIEGVPPVEEGELDSRSLLCKLWEHSLRCRLVELIPILESRAPHVM